MRPTESPSAKRLASISTFKDPEVAAPADPDVSPSKAAAYWLSRDIVRGVFRPMERLKVEDLVRPCQSKCTAC